MQTTPVKIVIVEDDPLLMRAYHDAVSASGFTVEMFFNADDAYRALLQMSQKPALILSDIMMPRMNGLQFLEKVRNSAELKHIPFIVNTSLKQQEHEEKALSLGASAYLVKEECTMKELVEKIAEFTHAKS